MIKHKRNCDFLKQINEISKQSWIVGEGEASGSVSIDTDRIYFNDGYDSHYINFKYCPVCGIELQESKKPNIQRLYRNWVKKNHPKIVGKLIQTDVEYFSIEFAKTLRP